MSKSKKRNSSSNKRRRTSTASKVAALARQVKEIGKSDEMMKWVDTSFSLAAGTTAGQVELANIPAWSGANITKYRQREGLSCNLVSLSFKGLVEIPVSQVTPNDANNRVRVILAFLKETSLSVTPTLSDILQTNIGGAVQTTVDSYYRKNPIYPYQIKYDKTFLLQSQQQATTGTTSDFPVEPFRRMIMENIRFGPTGTETKWATGGVPTVLPTQNRLFMFAISDSSIPTNPTVRLTTRLNFADIN